MLPSGLPERVDDDEAILRFVFQSNLLSKGQVKHQAFLPAPLSDKIPRLGTPVFRHPEEPKEAVRELGLVVLGNRPNKLHGAAVVSAKSVRQASLEIEGDEPPVRHALILGWAMVDTDPETQKARNMDLAIALAAAAKFVAL